MNEEQKRNSQIEALIQACQKNSIDDVKRLVSTGTDINGCDSNGNTCLFYCNSTQHLYIVRFLVSHGIDLNKTNIRGNSALHLAVEKNCKQHVLIYLLNGADITLHNRNNKLAEDMNMEVKRIFYQVREDRDSISLLQENQNRRLVQIFEDMDGGDGYLDIEKCVVFNDFMDDVSDDAARRDAMEFMRDICICEMGRVNIEEWLLSFARLAKHQGSESIDNFIEDFDRNIREKGKYVDYRNKRI